MIITIIRGLLFIPLYINFIGVRLYGLWLASGGVLVWLTMLDLGLGQGVAQRVASHYGKKDYEKTGQYFINGLLIYTIFGVLFFSIGYLISFPLPSWLKAGYSDSGILRACFQLAVAAGFLKILNDVLRGFATSVLRPLFPLTSLLIWNILGLVSTVVLLFKSWGLWAIPIGHLVTQGGLIFFNGGFALVLLKKLGVRFKVDRSIMSDLLNLTPSLFVARIGQSIVKSIEPLLITVILYPELTTAFVVTRRAADLVSHGLHIIVGSTLPGFAHLVGQENMKRSAEIVRLMMTFIVYSGLIGFGTYIVSNGPFVKIWLGEQFYLGREITMLIAISIMIRVIHDVVSELLVGAGDIIFSSYLVFAESTVRVIAMTVLIYFIGVPGAPMGMILTCSAFAIVLGIRIYKRFDAQPVFPQAFSIIKSFSVSVVIIVLFMNFYLDVNSWTSFSIFSIAVFISLFVANLVNGEYRRMIYKIM